jgi:hypothetical protein
MASHRIIVTQPAKFKVFIALMMEAVRTFETSVYFDKIICCYVPEGCRLHTRRSENLKYEISLLSNNYSFMASSVGISGFDWRTVI